MTDLEYRTATHLEVRHAERIIELIAVPYDEPTELVRRNGRMVTETVDPGAFLGVAGSVTVNRAHDVEAPLGRVVKLRPNDPRGLRADLRISRTREGDDALELAADGLLSPSVGFQVLQPGGEQWNPARTAVRVMRARLAHIAMTGDPAYRGAKVLAVRDADHPDALPRVATPNLDRLRLEVLADRAGYALPSPQTQ